MPAVSRRDFVKLASVGYGAMLIGFDPRNRSWITAADCAKPPWAKLPKLDGALLFDDATRDLMSRDAAQSVHRVPAAVLRPASVSDIVKMVKFANEHDIKIAERGQGHSQYGQSLVDGGIVIDSSTLNAVRLLGGNVVEAQAGATWNDVTRVTLAGHLTPPAMGNTMILSVGGILSAGGISNRSLKYGAVIDNVRELDVVTGDGKLMTCSPTHNRELFEMVLGGMGQCALIAAARLQLEQAPTSVARQDFWYDDLSMFLGDLTRLTTEARVDHIAGYGPLLGGESRFRINVGAFGATPAEAHAVLEASDMHSVSHTEIVIGSYADYLQREAATNAAIAASRRATPIHGAYIAFFIPLTAVEGMIRSIVSSPDEMMGVARFPIQPLPGKKFGRPLLRLPQSDAIAVLWLFRSIPATDSAGFATATAANRAILDRVKAVGGKAYPPYTPYFTSADWKAHYGEETWKRLSSAKRQFDPRAILTPGPGVFSSASNS